MYDEPLEENRYEEEEENEDREFMILDVAACVLPILVGRNNNMTAKELAKESFKIAEELIKEHERRLEAK